MMLFVLICALSFAGTMQAGAATNTNVVTSAKKVSGGKWVKTSAGKKYRYSDGTYAKNVWLKVNGNIYRFNSKGICQTGWIEFENKSYYAAKDGVLYIKKWLDQDGDRYYFQSNGVCAKYKWLTISKKTYFFLKSGRLAKNRMFPYEGKYYYVNKNGVKVTSTWVRKGGYLYYFGSDGSRTQLKWVKYKGEYYYLGSDGRIVKNQWVGNYYVGSDGKRLKNCVKDGYYLNASGKKVIKVFKGKYIFVGDSRMVGMEMSIAPSNTLYLAKNGQGYNWLKKTAGVTLGYYLKTNPNVKVVLALGVNDLGNISSYITYYKSLIKKYPKTKFYVLSVNPVDEAKEKKHGYSVKNSAINAFNKKLYTAFKSRYVDTNSYMKTNGYETRDGLHYTVPVYQDLYNYIVKMIQ